MTAVVLMWFFWFPLYGYQSNSWALAGPFNSRAACVAMAFEYQHSQPCFTASTREQFDSFLPRIGQ